MPTELLMCGAEWTIVWLDRSTTLVDPQERLHIGDLIFAEPNCAARKKTVNFLFSFIFLS